MAIHHVFVYGTLMREMDNFHLIAPYAGAIEPGETAGELFHLDYGYPTLVSSAASTVQGELVRLKDVAAALPVLDHLEGYRGTDHPDNLYERVVCQVATAGGETVEAYVYRFSHPERLSDIGIRVRGGCWRQFMAERRDDVPDRYYFAYGSCMEDGYLAASGYAADFQRVGPARLDGWRFRLNKRHSDGFATANIVPAKDGAVYGILYHITGRAEKEFLNCRGGYPQHYFKEYLDVMVGETVYPSAVVHVARQEYIDEHLPVKPDYASRLRRAAENLLPAYRGELFGELDRRHG
ncbi:MAG: gamma-glutamylcyclotransferase [Negativicutes bacterium]|nr:gamma-glutamylcyclotransferase [Negativicutes bacterium]